MSLIANRLLSVVLAGALFLAFIVKADAAKSTHPTQSSSKSLVTFSAFMKKLHSEGADNFIRPNVAPFLELTPNSPSKAYIVDELARQEDRQPEKICNLVLEKAESSDTLTPKCAVIIDGYVGTDKTVSHYYKVGLDGKLLSAVRLSGKVSSGKPVRGSGVKTDLDINSPEVQASFKKELDFWLSGRYKKYWKPKPGVKTAQN